MHLFVGLSLTWTGEVIFSSNIDLILSGCHIIFNPPYLPKEEDPKDWIDYSYSSSEVMVLFVGYYRKYLNENGRVYIVNSSLSGVELVGKKLASRKLPFEEISVVLLSCKNESAEDKEECSH